MAISLRESYPGLVCDLDGVVYRGTQAVPFAVEQLSRPVSGSPGGVVYATNNASRTPQEVAEHLRDLGLEVSADRVINSSMTGAGFLAGRLRAGAPVLAVGGAGVGAALTGAELDPVTPQEAAQGAGPVEAVLQGYGAQVTAGHLAEVAYAVQSGAMWVVTNDDRTLPTDRGVAPGNGSLVAAVRMAVGVDPEVVGKPGPLMYQLAARQLGTEPRHTLGIGDRLETDVAGAHAAGMDALLVLTGVHGVADVVGCGVGLRPRFVARDLRSLDEPYEEPVSEGDAWRIGDLVGTVVLSREKADIRFEGARSDGGQGQAGLRIALKLLWSALDADRLTTRAAVAAIGPWQ